MRREYREAFSEVNEIIKLMPTELVDKIPMDFIEIIEREKSKEYFPNIQEPIENVNLKKETIILLGLIYRDFLCTPEEKQKIYEEEKIQLELLEKENELKEKTNYAEVLKNIADSKKESINIENSEEKSLETRMITIQKEKWYQKIFGMLKKIFK